MPPKKGQKKGAKSPKLSKAQKEQLKKEEAERKAQEEEEARLKAEQEAKEKEERERQEKEERRKLEEQERARHQAEIDELYDRIQQNKEKLANRYQKTRIQEKWDRYMLCDGRPDPTCTKDINTYKNLWKDEEHFKSINTVLKECQLTLQIINELEKIINEEDEHRTEQDVESSKVSIQELQELINYKLDEATMHVMKNPDNNIDRDTLNLLAVMKSEFIDLCIWGNTAKNPRVKSIEFPGQGFTMEIPKSLALADVAVRAVYMNYDHLSPKCSTFYPKKKKQQKIEEEEKQESDQEKPSEEPLESDQETEKQTVSMSVTGQSEKNSVSRRASTKSIGQASTTGVTTSMKDQEEKDIEDSSLQCQDAGKLIEDLDADIEDDDLIDDDVVDLRSFSSLGPIVNIELLQLPPQPKQIKGWIIQQIVSPDLKTLTYNCQTYQGSRLGTSQGALQNQHSNNENKPPTSATSRSSEPSITPSVPKYSPLAISLRLRDDIILFEQPQLARWDENSLHWRQDGFMDEAYDEENKVVSFKTGFFGPIAIMQDLYLNMPFQAWELRPRFLNNCLFLVIAATIEIEIEIKNSICCLKKPDDRTEVNHLRNQWMTPEELIKGLKRAGINIFPSEDGEKYVSVSQKEADLVESMYNQMALSASAFAYSWSKWNNSCGKEDTVVVQGVESYQDIKPEEDDYALYMSSTRICCKLAVSEYDDQFSTDVANDTQMHPDLFHMVQDGASEEASYLVNDSSFLFVDAVFQLLSATNVLIYS